MTSLESLVSIPQAVSTVATFNNILGYNISKVSIPQAVSTVATEIRTNGGIGGGKRFQYRKR